VPREPGYGSKRSQDGEALADMQRASGRMPDANVRRRGTGSPEPHGRAGPHRSRDGGFLRNELSEGLPVPREPAYAAKRSQDGEALAASE
jgi:hypothetical protein